MSPSGLITTEGGRGVQQGTLGRVGDVPGRLRRFSGWLSGRRLVRQAGGGHFDDRPLGRCAACHFPGPLGSHFFPSRAHGNHPLAAACGNSANGTPKRLTCSPSGRALRPLQPFWVDISPGFPSVSGYSTPGHSEKLCNQHEPTGSRAGTGGHARYTQGSRHAVVPLLPCSPAPLPSCSLRCLSPPPPLR
jgi:hypothetical protein